MLLCCRDNHHEQTYLGEEKAFGLQVNVHFQGKSVRTATQARTWMQELRQDLDAGAGQNLDARAEVGSQRSAAYRHFSIHD